MKKQVYFNDNPLDLLPNSLCRVIHTSEDHFFSKDQNIIFTGWISIDYLEGKILYQMTGLIDGARIDQLINEDDFIIIKRAVDYGSN